MKATCLAGRGETCVIGPTPPWTRCPLQPWGRRPRGLGYQGIGRGAPRALVMAAKVVIGGTASEVMAADITAKVVAAGTAAEFVAATTAAGQAAEVSAAVTKILTVRGLCRGRCHPRSWLLRLRHRLRWPRKCPMPRRPRSRTSWPRRPLTRDREGQGRGSGGRGRGHGDGGCGCGGPRWWMGPCFRRRRTRLELRRPSSWS